MSNVYYSPGECGLEIAYSYQDSEPYQFDIFLILRHSGTGLLFWVQDNGCSCPTPFEDYYFKTPEDNDLNPITKETLDELETALKSYHYTGPDAMSDMQAIRSEVKAKGYGKKPNKSMTEIITRVRKFKGDALADTLAGEVRTGHLKTIDDVKKRAHEILDDSLQKQAAVISKLGAKKTNS